MANIFTSLHYHVIFSTKHREPWISPDFEERVWKFLGGIARENGMKAFLIGGMPDHVHLALALPPAQSVSKALQLLKGGSSKWIKDALPQMRCFAWQDGYGAFTVSKSRVFKSRSDAVMVAVGFIPRVGWNNSGVAERRLKFNPTNSVRRIPRRDEPETPGILPETFLPDDVRAGFECRL